MPRGRGGGGGGRKGGRRQFTNFEAESEKKEREEKEARWRAQRGEADSDEEAGSGESGSESESSEGEEGEAKVVKPKGVSGLIEQRNPNRTGIKANRKVTDLPEGGVKVELSRREREEIKKQQYVKLQEECKTDQARADLERLAVIKARRAEAEAKRKEEMEAKEAAAASATKKETVPKVGAKKKS